MSESDRIKSAEQRIKKFCNDRDWSQFHDPKNLAISLQLEASEVLELFQWTKNNEISDGMQTELPDELADVLYWVLMLANHYDIDLLDAFDKKMDKNELKYPIERAKGNSAKYSKL